MLIDIIYQETKKHHKTYKLDGICFCPATAISPAMLLTIWRAIVLHLSAALGLFPMMRYKEGVRGD
jgi:hypothetical protein